MGKLHRTKGKTNRTSLICQTCGVGFYPVSGHLKQKTCSRVCGHKLRIKNGGTRKGKHYEHLQRARMGNCLICGKEYRAIKDFKAQKQKYCSRECYEKAWTKEIRPRLKTPGGKRGIDNPEWKGDEAGYSAKHYWLSRKYGKPKKCEMCGTIDANKYEWANKDHKYKRIRKDWMRVCTRCHRRYDYENN